jgi:hypothetical protein
MTGLRNGPSRSAWRARANARFACLETQLERESVSPRPEESTTLVEGKRGYIERARTAADEKFGPPSQPHSDSLPSVSRGTRDTEGRSAGPGDRRVEGSLKASGFCARAGKLDAAGAVEGGGGVGRG